MLVILKLIVYLIKLPFRYYKISLVVLVLLAMSYGYNEYRYRVAFEERVASREAARTETVEESNQLHMEETESNGVQEEIVEDEDLESWGQIKVGSDLVVSIPPPKFPYVKEVGPWRGSVKNAKKKCVATITGFKCTLNIETLSGSVAHDFRVGMPSFSISNPMAAHYDVSVKNGKLRVYSPYFRDVYQYVDVTPENPASFDGHIKEYVGRAGDFHEYQVFIEAVDGDVEGIEIILEK